MSMDTISATELAQRLAQGDVLSLVDVREPWEFALARIDGAINIPLGSLPTRWQEIDTTRPVVAICHHGMRSAQACRYLAHQGIASLINLTGGVAAWAEDVDPVMPQY
jgi:rhodanese-related sulfurtransferase